MCDDGQRSPPATRAPGPITGAVPDAAETWELLEHPADLRLRVRAPDAPGLYRAAVAALHAVMDGGTMPGRDASPALDEPMTIRLEGTDPADLLVRLLNEVIFLVETTGRLARLFAPELVTDTLLAGTLRLVPVASPHELTPVKAATYGDLRIDWSAGGVTAEITLDL